MLLDPDLAEQIANQPEGDGALQFTEYTPEVITMHKIIQALEVQTNVLVQQASNGKKSYKPPRHPHPRTAVDDFKDRQAAAENARLTSIFTPNE